MPEFELDSLSADQLTRALLSFFDSLPQSAWKDEDKPSPMRVQKAVEHAEEQTTGSSLDIVRALRTPGNEEAKAATAKWTLMAFHEQPAFRAMVEQAVTSAKKPHMSPIPPEFIFIAVALVTMAIKFKRTSTTEKQTITADGTSKTSTNTEFGIDFLSAVKEGLPALAESLPRALTSLFKR